jgi:hypothetical protein
VINPQLPPPLARIDEQRNAIAAARRDLRSRSIAVQDAEAALADLQRSARSRDAQRVEEARGRITAARTALAQARKAAATTAAGLRPLIDEALPRKPEDEVGQLAADRPIVLLPVRLETRFADSELLVRIYPDDIFADSHEPELTDLEIADGEEFWTNAWPDEASERTAWKVLVDAIGVPRAAWVASETTPTNLAARPGAAPVFPVVARRATAWTRAAEAHLLPDRWIITLYRGAASRSVTSALVHEPLALTMSPDPSEPRSALSDDGLEIDDALRWTVDFRAAEAVGMGVRIELTPEEQAAGFDRVVAIGVKSSLSPERVPDALGALLENHRHSRGVSLVAQGTPTNNTAAAAAPFPPPDPGGAVSFGAERREVTPVDGCDGGHLMAALGLPAANAAHWPGADGRSEDSARAMARALWPSTLRYFLEQMMSPVAGQDTISLAQSFFVNHVRGRGPLPAFRIGSTPYGVLPVSSLENWQTEKPVSALDRELPGMLRRLLPFWEASTGSAPHSGRTDDPDGDLLGILGMDASTREVRLRSVLGEDFQQNLFSWFGWDSNGMQWWDYGQAITNAICQALGYPEWNPRIGRANFGATAWPYQFGLVSEDPAAEHDVLAPNYIEWITGATVPDLMAQRFPAAWTRPPRSLLYKMLRHGALLEYHDASFALLRRYERLTEDDRREREMVGFTGPGGAPNRAERLNLSIPQLTGNQPLHVFLSSAARPETLRMLLPNEEVVGLKDALSVLAPLPTAELERLFGETLDTVSHRIDAWISALASKRLAELRSDQPLGAHLGAYGWVEPLRPRPPAGGPIPLPGGGQATRQSGNGGFIQSPSLTHGAAAAVLRNAYLSRSGASQEQFAVDLSSARVRLGRFVLDAVREGQPLGAVLGYQLERALHDRLQDVAIDPLRRSFPLVAGKSKDPADLTEPADQIAARNVVDGLALRTAYREKKVTAELLGLDPDGATWAAVVEEIATLDETADAVADLLLAESVYQLVKGSPDVAAATLDAMAQGSVRPPDPEIATVPRRGTALIHRVAVVLGGSPAALPPGWPVAATPRAELEPLVDAWLGGLFGDPRTIKCQVELGPIDAPTGRTTVSLDLLGLRPIDVLAIARTLGEQEPGATQAGASELDRRVRDAAYTKAAITAETDVRIGYGVRPAGFDPVSDRTLADVLELARAAEQVMRASRPLTATDLVAEDKGAEAKAANARPDEAVARATQTCTQLEAALNTLDPALAAAVAAPDDVPFDLTALRGALRDLALAGGVTAYPLSSLGSAVELRAPLITQARSASLEWRDRLTRARSVLTEADGPDHAADAAYRVAAATEAIGIAVGAATPFLPRFGLRPAGSAVPSSIETELANAITHSGGAAFIGATEAARAREIGRFELVAARVRAPLDAWRRLELTAGLLGRAHAPRAVAQLPYEAGARWAALPFADEEHRPRPGRLSILMHRVASPTTSAPWAGLFLDQWVEMIARPTEQTGIALHYDNPGADAPQAILIAVPPTSRPLWDLASLLAILSETLDLAQVRTVDGELLGALGQVLPAIYLADSTEEVTVRTQFAGTLTTETTVMPHARVD